MRRVLVPISASNAAAGQAAIEEAIQLCRVEPVQIHLLNVQLRLSRHIGAFFSPEELQAIHLESGMEELAVAKAALDAAGMPYTAHVRVGRSAETIVQVAREIGCDRILMGRSADAGLAERLFGTLASQVRHLLGADTCTVVS